MDALCPCTAAVTGVCAEQWLNYILQYQVHIGRCHLSGGHASHPTLQAVCKKKIRFVSIAHGQNDLSPPSWLSNWITGR